MSLDWLPSNNKLKNHDLWDDEYFSFDPPGIIYELKPVVDSGGNKIKD